MDILTTVLTVIYVFCCFFLIFVVLIQKGEGGGLGGAFGGGAVDVAFGAKADMTWKRATAAAAALFIILAVTIGILQEQLYDQSGAQKDKPVAEKPADGEKPAGGAPKKPADGTPEKPADGTPEKPADGGDGK